MILGIVGSEKAKFTSAGRLRAIKIIYRIIEQYDPELIVSGACPLGGIDIWAEEAAAKLGRRFREYAPKENNWDRGFKPRNIKIAEASDLVVCISIDKLPGDFQGRRFIHCYHCQAFEYPDWREHVKSGGCWTTKHARSIGKTSRLIVIKN